MCLSIGPIKYVKNGPAAMFWSKELHQHGGSILASGRFAQSISTNIWSLNAYWPKTWRNVFFLPISYNITISWLYPLNSSQFIFSLRDMRLHFVVGRLLNLLFYVIWRSHTPQHHNRAHFRVAFEASLSKWGLERCTTILEMTLFACKEISFVYSLRLALRKRLKTKRFLSGLLSRARTQTTRFGF